MAHQDHPLLQVSGLCKSYRLGARPLPVLSDLSLTIAAGEMVVIMGPSGSGKTTLLNCLSGIDPPDGGQVRLRGDLLDYTSERVRTELRRRHIGMVFQFFNLIPSLTVAENVSLPFLIGGRPTPAQDLRAAELLRAVGLQGRAGHLPHQLSGGEMQLASIARALVHAPALLLADEPTGNVNPVTGRSIMAMLRAVAEREGSGVLMVTHSPEHAAWADRICFLKDGALVDQLHQGGRADDAAAVHARLLALGI